MSSNTNPRYAHGGIGDLLQFLEHAMEVKEIDIYSHFATASDVFTPFGVTINRFEKYDSLNQSQELFCPGELLERRYFFSEGFQLPRSPIGKIQKRKTIGIHVEGSSFSNDFWKSRGMPTKNMSPSFIRNLVLEIQNKFPDVHFYLFVSPNRLYEIGQLLAKDIKQDYTVVAFKRIWDSLVCVAHCDFVIGMDSCIKSMSGMLRIPTHTLVGKYPDPFRDENFLTPYLKDGKMTNTLFSDIDKVDVKELVSQILL